MKRILFALFSVLLLAAEAEAGAAPEPVNVTVRQQALPGRIAPMLFGNFVELLDDVVPGMWAEMLNDRSFEGVIPAASWCYYDGSLDICDRQWDTNGTWRLDTQNVFNGSRCALLSPGAEPATLSQSQLAVKKSMAYGFSGYFRAEGNLRILIRLKCLLPNGDWMTLAEEKLPPPSGQWQKRTGKLLAKGETDRAVFEVRAEGRGRLWADKLSLMPRDNLSGWRRDVVESIREMKPSVVRWGGSSIDPGRYLWKNGVGDRDLRVPWRNENWGRIDPNDVGIDEFCQFCALTGSEPLVCVSFADGSQSARDLVEYCNGSSSTIWGARRAANGHAQPYGIKYWQIGNEISGNDPAYLAQILSFIEAMKHSDPAAQVMSSFPHQQLLERAGQQLAFVCPHHYTPDLEACDRDFTALSRMLDSVPGCSHIKIGVTEWNIDAGSWGLGRAKQATLGAALINARYLHLLMRHADKVRLACRSNLANSFSGAVIETGIGGTGVLRRASYYVMKLYANHVRPIPLVLEAHNADLDLFACAAEDRTSGAVFAVNPKTEAAVLSLRFVGFDPGSLAAESVSDRLNAGQPDIMNHWQNPERICIVKLPPVQNHKISLPPLSATVIDWTL